MKKILFILVLTFIGNFVIGQTVVTEFKAKVSCSQKYGLSTAGGDYVLTVVIDETTMKFNTSKEQAMTSYTIGKKTDKYVIGTDASNNYAFYDIKKKQFYYIDYFMSRYSTAGYGSGYSTIKQTVLKMMDLLKNGSTQKDVIQHLIKQAEYDF